MFSKVSWGAYICLWVATLKLSRTMDKRLGAGPELDNFFGRDLPVLHLLLLALPAGLALVLGGHGVRGLLLAGLLHLWFDFCVDWLFDDTILGQRFLLLG